MRSALTHARVAAPRPTLQVLAAAVSLGHDGLVTDPDDDVAELLGDLDDDGDDWLPAESQWRDHPLRHEQRARPVTYRVRLDLLDAKPPIWRRLDLASDIYLDDLHAIIQVAMGWDDAHLHAFSVGRQPFSHHGFQFANDYVEGYPFTHEAEVRLDETLREPGDRLRYTYDFGDTWRHSLRLEEVRPRGAGHPAFTCVTGRRACPPEDCGGIWGYQALLAYLENPLDTPDWFVEQAEEFLDGERFDPTAFEVQEVNKALDAIRA